MKKYVGISRNINMMFCTKKNNKLICLFRIATIVTMTDVSMTLATCMNADTLICLPAEISECVVAEEISYHLLYLHVGNLSHRCLLLACGDHHLAVWVAAWEMLVFQEVAVTMECIADDHLLRQVPCPAWEVAECMKILAETLLMIGGEFILRTCFSKH